MITLDPGHASLSDLLSVFESEGPVTLSEDSDARIAKSAEHVRVAAQGDASVYGVNTGFGKLAQLRIAPKDTEHLQRNLILSHCCGVGDRLETPTTRLMMALKLLSLGRGASGVQEGLITLLEGMLSKAVTPIIPKQGSVGASGDLAPLAHMAAVMIGDGKALASNGSDIPGAEALQRAGLSPIVLGPKEGLALINGTQFSTACALSALFKIWRITQAQVVIAALSTDAIMGSDAPLHPEIHRLRGQKGQIDVAASMAALLEGSQIRESHREDDPRVQDPYCIRCQPQVAGAALDLLRFAGRTLRIEANAVTDNPLVLDTGEIVSGGNFHAEPVAFAADQIALAVAELGAISQRRIALMVDPVMNHNLPAFLSSDPGLNSGLMIAEVTSAALMSENRHLANPCSTDSTPTSANQEDHVSMAAHGAVRLSRMADNLAQIVGIEAICAAQAIEARAPLHTSKLLQTVHEEIRRHVAGLETDRYLSDDLKRAAQAVGSGALSGLSTLTLEWDI